MLLFIQYVLVVARFILFQLDLISICFFFGSLKAMKTMKTILKKNELVDM